MRAEGHPLMSHDVSSFQEHFGRFCSVARVPFDHADSGQGVEGAVELTRVVEEVAGQPEILGPWLSSPARVVLMNTPGRVPDGLM